MLLRNVAIQEKLKLTRLLRLLHYVLNWQIIAMFETLYREESLCDLLCQARQGDESQW